MGNCGIGLGQRDKDGSEFGVCASELDGKGGEDELEVAPVLEVSGTEEGSAEPSVCERPFRNRLRDGGLSCSSQPIKPVNRRLGKVTSPEFNPI